MAKTIIGRRTKNIYDPSSAELFKLSRSKLENFLRCPRCFYLDRRLGVDQPGGYPFTLNVAVDHLLKKEFDIHRAAKTRHPLMERYGIGAVPYQHADLDKWRENFVGVQVHHRATNLLITGAVDDIWVNSKDALHVVEYKATAKDGQVSLDAEWQKSYKQQVEIYQWLLRQQGFTVSDTGYFVYVNGRRDRKAFDGKLEFDVTIIPYRGSDGWVEQAIVKAHRCLMDDALPAQTPECEFCAYRSAAKDAMDRVGQQARLWNSEE